MNNIEFLKSYYYSQKYNKFRKWEILFDFVCEHGTKISAMKIYINHIFMHI